MKYIVLGFVLVMVAFGASVALTAALQYSEEQQIETYIESRGKAPMPRSWYGKVGKGI